MKKIFSLMLLPIIIVTAAFSLSGCGNTAADKWSGLTDLKVPWGDYEEFVYNYSVNGKPVDDIKFIVEKLELNGAGVFRIQDTLLVKEGEFVTGAVVEADTLRPVSSFFTRHPPELNKDKLLEITGDYRDKLYIAAKSNKNTQNFQVKLSGECLDNEAAVMAIRAMPLTEGFSKVINLCILSTAKSVPFQVRVTGMEKITVPFGVAECYAVELQYKGFMPAPAIKLWYTADDKKIMMKYSQDNNKFELKTVKYEK